MNALPHTCKIAVFSSVEQPIRLEEVAIPPLQPGEILVRNEYTTLCRSDLNTFIGKRTEKTPTILGHEIVGRIAALGPDSPPSDLRGAPLAPGNRITWGIYASSPNSPQAQAGIPQKGPDLFKYGHERITDTSTLHGGLGEYTLLRVYTPIVRIDEQIPLKVAALVNCSVATVAGALRLAGDLGGKNVLISGAGMLGMIACAMSKLSGATRVVARDVNLKRLKFSRQFGADFGLLVDNQGMTNQFIPSDWEKDFHVVIELSGVASAIESTLAMLTTGGTAVWVGATYPQPPLQIEAEKVVRNIWTIKGLHNYNQKDFISAVGFMEQHHRTFPFDTLIYDHFDLNQVNEAFKYAIEASPFRVGVSI